MVKMSAPNHEFDEYYPAPDPKKDEYFAGRNGGRLGKDEKTFRGTERVTWGLPLSIGLCRKEREDRADNPHKRLLPCEEWGTVPDRSWIKNGVISLSKNDFVVAFSDLHGDVGLLKAHLFGAGLIDLDFKWLNANAIVVICGDLVDDCREPAGTCNHVRPLHSGASAHELVEYESVMKEKMALGSWINQQMSERDFDGDTAAPHGSNTWNMFMLIRFLIERGARIATVVGNHEVMRMEGDMNWHNYARQVSKEYEKTHGLDDWRSGQSVVRKLFGDPIIMACAGSVLFIHADAPNVRKEDQILDNSNLAKMVEQYNAEFTKELNEMHHAFIGGTTRPLTQNLKGFVWGRSLGLSLTAGKCKALKETMGHVLVVRGHCINDIGPLTVQAKTTGCMVHTFHFADGGDAKRALERACKMKTNSVRVGRAGGPATKMLLDRFHGITLACYGARPASASKFGGAVLRVDCGASYGFGGGYPGALVCITFSAEQQADDVYCVVGAHRPPLTKAMPLMV